MSRPTSMQVKACSNPARDTKFSFVSEMCLKSRLWIIQIFLFTAIDEEFHERVNRVLFNLCSFEQWAYMRTRKKKQKTKQNKTKKGNRCTKNKRIQTEKKRSSHQRRVSGQIHLYSPSKATTCSNGNLKWEVEKAWCSKRPHCTICHAGRQKGCDSLQNWAWIFFCSFRA